MKNYCVFCFLMILGISGCRDKADYVKLADDAFNKGDYKTAVAYYKKAADLGDPYAQDILANLYERGIGVRKDPKKAYKLFMKASQNGFKMSNYNIGMMYYRGVYVKKDIQKAKAYLAASELVPLSTFMLGKIYLSEKEYKKAFGYFIKSCAYDDDRSLNEVENMYRQGHIGRQDIIDGIEYMKSKYCDQEACERLCSLLSPQPKSSPPSSEKDKQ